MQTNIQAEVLLCPNCKEEVPKTLYCLNCGYPLYKEDLTKAEPEEAEDVSVEVAPEPFSLESIIDTVGAVSIEAEDPPVAPLTEEKAEIEAEPEPAIEPMEQIVPVGVSWSERAEEEVDFEVELVQLKEMPMEYKEPTDEVTTPVVESFDVVEAVTVREEEVSHDPEEPEVVEAVTVREEEVSHDPEEPEVVEAVTIQEEIESLEPEEPEVVEAVTVEEEIESLPEEPEVAEVIEEIDETQEEIAAEEPISDVAETATVFEPEPVIMEVMENLAKNISMKIKLVSLFQEGEVKTETFDRLFNTYVARGELLMNSRNETLERVRYDLDSRERALNDAKIGLDELMIRKAIGDVSEEEYQAKSPGFEWDIGHYKDDFARKKAEIAYLDDLTQVMSNEEIAGLKEQGEAGYGALDDLAGTELTSPDTAARIKVTLEEALTCLNASCK